VATTMLQLGPLAAVSVADRVAAAQVMDLAVRTNGRHTAAVVVAAALRSKRARQLV
jgi:hypothetical protein